MAQIFEVDQALVLSFKKKIISGTSAQKMISDKKMDGCEARVVEVEADLKKTGWDGELVGAGFDPALPSAWILEGLIMSAIFRGYRRNERQETH